MDKSKILLGLLLVFFGFNFTSCEDKNEAVDPTLLNQVPVATCAKPTVLEVSEFIGTAVNVTWTATEGVSWEIQYGLHGFVAGSGTVVISDTSGTMVNGLTTTNNYDFYIRTNCANGLHSAWIGPVSVGGSAAGCAKPTNFTALRAATNTEVNLTWNANGDENTWEVQYGTMGFALGSGTIISVSAPSKTISGLLANTAYDFYVRSNCSATDNSSWVGPFHVNAVP
jgi:hypothetical protein